MMIHSTKNLLQIYFWTIAAPAVAVALLSCGGSTDPAKPDRLLAVNGTYYKGTMGSDVVEQPLSFKLTDKSGNAYANKVITFDLVDGNGEFAVDSGITNASGVVTAQYKFSGSRGDAVIGAHYPGINSTTAVIRASTIITGGAGQGQYIMFTDLYERVKQFNGTPISVDPDPRFYINYANYEAAFGVVVILDDSDSSETASNSEEVRGVIVNTVYTGKTADSIGIGSTIADLRAVYGPPDTIRTDITPPVAAYIRYNALGLTCYGERTGDTVIFEIHVVEPPVAAVADSMPSKKRYPARQTAASSVASYRSHRF